MSVDPTRRPLPAADNARLKQLRRLSNYKLSYINPKFPVLSFLYAVYAGGENTLYCDFTDEYVKAYLTGPSGQLVARVFAELEPDRFREPPPRPSPAQLQRIWEALYIELVQDGMPEPFW